MAPLFDDWLRVGAVDYCMAPLFPGFAFIGASTLRLGLVWKIWLVVPLSLIWRAWAAFKVLPLLIWLD